MAVTLIYPRTHLVQMEKNLILQSVFAQTEAKLRTAENPENENENEKQKNYGNLIGKHNLEE